MWRFPTGRNHDQLDAFFWEFANPNGELECSEERKKGDDCIPAPLHARPKAVSSDDPFKNRCMGGVADKLSLIGARPRGKWLHMVPFTFLSKRTKGLQQGNWKDLRAHHEVTTQLNRLEGRGNNILCEKTKRYPCELVARLISLPSFTQCEESVEERQFS